MWILLKFFLIVFAISGLLSGLLLIFSEDVADIFTIIATISLILAVLTFFQIGYTKPEVPQTSVEVLELPICAEQELD